MTRRRLSSSPAAAPPRRGWRRCRLRRHRRDDEASLAEQQRRCASAPERPVFSRRSLAAPVLAPLVLRPPRGHAWRRSPRACSPATRHPGAGSSASRTTSTASSRSTRASRRRPTSSRRSRSPPRDTAPGRDGTIYVDEEDCRSTASSRADAAGRVPQGHRGARRNVPQAPPSDLPRASDESTQDAIIADLECRQGGRASSRRRQRLLHMLQNDTARARSPTRSTAATAARRLETDRLSGRATSLDGGRAQAGPHKRTIQGLRDMPPMNPGHPQPHVILPLAGSAKGRKGLMATKHPKVDVVTIGAGWTSAILGAKLCPKGTTMVALEQGTHRWTYPDFAHDHDSLRYSVRYAMMVDLARETWTWRPDPRKPALPMRQYGSFNPGEGLGGAAIHWSAQLWRFLQTTSATAPTSSSATARRSFRGLHDPGLAGRLRRPRVVLRRVRVGHRRLRDRRQRPRRDPARRQPVRGAAQPRLPNPPLATNRFADMFGSAARSSACTRSRSRPGSPHAPSPTRTATFAPAASTAASAPASAARSTRRRARRTRTFRSRSQTGRYDVRLGCKVLRIETGGDGLATGVTYVDGKGQEHFQPADVVVASAFTLENTRLLLLSRSRQHPTGSATTAAASGGTTPTRSTRRPSSACGRARS